MKENENKQIQEEKEVQQDIATAEQEIQEEKNIEEENIEEENATTENTEQEHISYDEFKNSLPTPEKRSLSNLEKSPLFSKLREYFSTNTPHIIQDNGVVPMCISTISLRYSGDQEFCIRTRNKGYKIQKGDVVILPDNAYGRAYERMGVFEKL